MLGKLSSDLFVGDLFSLACILAALVFANGDASLPVGLVPRVITRTENWVLSMWHYPRWLTSSKESCALDVASSYWRHAINPLSSCRDTYS